MWRKAEVAVTAHSRGYPTFHTMHVRSEIEQHIQQKDGVSFSPVRCRERGLRRLLPEAIDNLKIHGFEAVRSEKGKWGDLMFERLKEKEVP